MATNFLRSSRRSEGLKTRSNAHNNVAILGNPPLKQQPNIRRKRPRDSLEEEKQSINAKRARISVEITVLPKTQPKPRSVVIQAADTIKVLPRRPALAAPPATVKAAAAAATQTPPEPPPKKPTIHHQKVHNGLQHELHLLKDTLSPHIPNAKDEKRKLRSQEGTRFKSELSLYFPEYDEIIGNEEKEQYLLNYDTPILLVDTAKSRLPPSTRKHEYPLKDFASSLFDNLHNAERVDFSWKRVNGFGKDPLSDEYFESTHRKPERAERAVRNSDRGRAQHEKDQVIRLLEGLQGPDWLKLMGVSGVTDSRKKEFEPARLHFMTGCKAIIHKFRTWREEEKRRKLEKEQAMAEAEEEPEEEAVEDETDDATGDAIEIEARDGYSSDGDPPDYSDVDASAARQLHEEAIARSAPLHASKRGEKRAKAELIPLAVHELEKDFKSFFAKPHLREAALGRSRRSARVVAAWGHPIPEVDEMDFDLPEDLRDEGTLKTNARKRRSDRRGSKN